jgi:ATP-dependent Lon protease
MAVAIISAVANRPARSDVAMTGEITLRGKVLPIGGLTEKLLAAQRSGIKTVMIPKENEKDLTEIQEKVKEGLRIVAVENIRDALQYIFRDRQSVPPVEEDGQRKEVFADNVQAAGPN